MIPRTVPQSPPRQENPLTFSLTVANGDSNNVYDYYSQLSGPPLTTTTTTNNNATNTTISQHAGTVPAAQTVTQAPSGQEPPTGAAGSTEGWQLQALYQEAMALRSTYERLNEEQAASPTPERSRWIAEIVEQHNAVCVQYQQLFAQLQQAQAHGVSTHQPPEQPHTQPSHTQPSHKRPDPSDSLVTQQPAKHRRTSSRPASPDDTPLSRWNPTHAIGTWLQINGAQLQDQLEQTTINALAVVSLCESPAEIVAALSCNKFTARGFASLLEVPLQSGIPALENAAGHLALACMLHFCAHPESALPVDCVEAMSKCLGALKAIPRGCELNPSLWAGLAQLPRRLQVAYTDLINDLTVKRD